MRVTLGASFEFTVVPHIEWFYFILFVGNYLVLVVFGGQTTCSVTKIHQNIINFCPCDRLCMCCLICHPLLPIILLDIIATTLTDDAVVGSEWFWAYKMSPWSLWSRDFKLVHVFSWPLFWIQHTMFSDLHTRDFKYMLWNRPGVCWIKDRYVVRNS